MLEALGQALFSLSLGMGAMLTYGSYADEKTNLSHGSLFGILYGYPCCSPLRDCHLSPPSFFTYGMLPAGGPGLVFKTLPIVFSRMPAGGLFAVLFFLLLVFAALGFGDIPSREWLFPTTAMNRNRSRAQSNPAGRFPHLPSWRSLRSVQ
ncbi:MAG: hypothetical protein MZU95_08325 [Desulfomicrobium escambiense]|nr:hypothetical protein [Desulfomicrobium escambiense]